MAKIPAAVAGVKKGGKKVAKKASELLGGMSEAVTDLFAGLTGGEKSALTKWIKAGADDAEKALRAELAANIGTKKRVGTTGQYVGAPQGIDTPVKVANARLDYYRHMDEGAKGRNWYHDSSRTINEIAPAQQAQHVADPKELLSRTIGLTSQGAAVDPNTNWGVKGYNQSIMGDVIDTGRFPGAVRSDVLRWLETGEGFGPKLDPFSEHVSVNWNPGVAATTAAGMAAASGQGGAQDIPVAPAIDQLPAGSPFTPADMAPIQIGPVRTPEAEQFLREREEARNAAATYAQRRASKADYWKGMRQKLASFAEDFGTFAQDAGKFAIENSPTLQMAIPYLKQMPWEQIQTEADLPLRAGLAGISAISDVAQGQYPSQAQTIMNQPSDQTLMNVGGQVTDLLAPYVPAPVAAGVGTAVYAVPQFISPI